MTTKCPTCGAECKVGGEGETHYLIPITKTELIKAQDEAYEKAALVCESEAVDYEATRHEEDKAYNKATEHCADAIRRLKSKP